MDPFAIACTNAHSLLGPGYMLWLSDIFMAHVHTKRAETLSQRSKKTDPPSSFRSKMIKWIGKINNLLADMYFFEIRMLKAVSQFT